MEIDETNETEVRKLKRVLELLLQSKTRVQNDCYLEKLLLKLSEKGDANLYKISFDWYLTMITACEAQETPHSTVVSFGLKLISLCHRFDAATTDLIVSQDVLTRTLGLITAEVKLQTASVMLSYVVLLKEVARTPKGMKFLKESELWRQLVNYKTPTIYIIREMSCFLYEIMKSFDVSSEETVVKSILEEILSPLLNSIWIGPDHAVQMDDPEIKQIIYKMLHILEMLLLQMMQDEELTHIPYYLFIEMGIENKLWKLRDISLTEEFTKKMILVITTANCVRFTCMKIPSKDTTTQQLKLEKFCINFYNFLNFGVMRKSADIVLAITELTTRHWYKQSSRRPSEELITTHKLKFGDQMLMIQLMPLLYVLKKESPSATDADYIDEFCQGMFSLSCEYTIRHMYAVRDVLRQNKKSNTDLACRAITAISASGAIIEKPRALIAFRSFVCSITEFLPRDLNITQSNLAYLSFDNPNFLLSLLTGVNSLIQTYGITCADNPNTNLHKIGLYLLCVSGLTTQHKIQVVKILENAMVHFSANQVPLMIGDLSGSGYEHLGYVIFKHLHDVEWDVRDSILELISAIIHISCIKFPVLQSLFLEENFCGAIVTMSQSDGEPYVRASALKCIKAMIRVSKLWTKLSQELDLIGHLCGLLLKEEEAIVRREAVDVLMEVYLHQRSPKSVLERILPTMIYCGAIDLHWEVRINALKFWDRLLEQCFTTEGMSDGVFPSQIFSTKLKKIIKLDPKAIKTKIESALDEFAQLRGFGVILTNLEDTTDTEVMKVATQIVMNLNKKLSKYDYQGTSSEEIVTDTPLIQESLKPEPAISISEKILDSVVDSDDISLLVTTHHNALITDDANRYNDTICQNFIKISANQFLHAVHDKDFESHIEAKVKWNDYTTDSFESLLDDILYSFNEFDHTDVNGMDCY